jgi:hypothetical protein
MPKPKKVVVSKERSVYTYPELLHTSNCVLKSGIANPKVCSWQFLSSFLLTAFGFEAYLNHVSTRTINCWEQIERLPPWSKFELLCETLNVTFPAKKDKRPLQTIINLLDFRNDIAHGKSLEVKINSKNCDFNDNLDSHLGERPLTHWERLIQTKEFAERVREDIEAVLNEIHNAIKDDKEHLFSFGMDVHGATLVQD